MRGVLPRIAWAAAIALLACGQEASNSVARFLDGAECQFESEDQKQVIEATLEDLLALPVDALKVRRYPDYRMNEGAWTALEVIHHYFVPASRASLPEEASFFEEVADPAAKQSIRVQLEALRAAPREEPAHG
jgi:hypothetical protein